MECKQELMTATRTPEDQNERAEMTVSFKKVSVPLIPLMVHSGLDRISVISP